MFNEEIAKECLENCMGVLLRYIDELYIDFVEENNLSCEFDDFEFEEIELSDADEYGSGEYDYSKKTEAKEEMNDQIETIISDASDAFKESAKDFSDCFDEAMETFSDRMDNAFCGIESISEVCIENLVTEDVDAIVTYCEERLKTVFSVIQTKSEEIKKFVSEFNCEDIIENYYNKRIGSVKDYAKLCDIEDDEDEDEDRVYAYILDDALDQIQEDVNDMLEGFPAEITSEFRKQLVVKFDELRLCIKDELKEYLDSSVVINSYKEDDGETYRIFNCDEEDDSYLQKRSSTFKERLEAEIVGTVWFLSGFLSW